MTNAPKPTGSHFAPEATVELKDVDDTDVGWGDDARRIADEAGLGSYGAIDEAAPDDPEREALWEETRSLRDEVRSLRRGQRAILLVFLGYLAGRLVAWIGAA